MTDEKPPASMLISLTGPDVSSVTSICETPSLTMKRGEPEVAVASIEKTAWKDADAVSLPLVSSNCQPYVTADTGLLSNRLPETIEEEPVPISTPSKPTARFGSTVPSYERASAGPISPSYEIVVSWPTSSVISPLENPAPLTEGLIG